MRGYSELLASRPAYKKISLFPSKEQNQPASSSSQSRGFILLGNRSRSKSRNHSKKILHQSLTQHRPDVKRQKISVKTETFSYENPEKQNQKRISSQQKLAKFEKSNIKRKQIIFGKEKLDSNFQIKDISGNWKFGFDCSNKRDENRSKSKVKKSPKLVKRLQRIKKYDLIGQCFSDLELEGFFNELQISRIPEVRWGLILIDKAYEKLKNMEDRAKSGQIRRL